jgi:nicotinate-nucleotide pyrophosphorylase (carboxylating)
MLSITPSIRAVIETALNEDLGHGDITTLALIPPDLRGIGSIMAKSDGIISGVEASLEVFRILDPLITTRILIPDGSEVSSSDIVAQIDGSIAHILNGERVALNLLQRLSGISTETNKYVTAIAGTKAHIIDTRKTIPGLRELEKYAVRMGGGHNHRFNLADGILIKDNHIAILKAQHLNIKDIIEQARQKSPHTLKIEIEVETIDEAMEAFKASADVILLDNMNVEEMKQVVDLIQGKCLLEASGGINLETVKAVANTGVDLISVGALTHSVTALDISLEMG